ncbi:UDP-glucose 6-dehydrogenase [Candidatus Roizmanbacteria bacterium RIFOXYB2_FULL_41_10]|nr:MAG: UDP-glucose 6-dehydrogenase [Candidatus Roizmanbacteria bacterium RIFOXYA2_FULL_41_8]OGK67555.1 MAG: UDP-glucose 6-dehydrogenase [Candidatus Roizmanbacteria bacterium RIFOXYB1_FULL_41_27]OGK70961.1 MAG: UDP-glucose 6-dehydrogenase [Candidatus Roizmanbacteria bacterium RIFOXYB2_FULL_41_10]OGK71211.1 MAG: UDP-glucose 6-dehydrogenase [Candidatus Roizmanbacteria bacterium RIFOXYC1_FULL_41_16]OGK74739.1 MAG: UDP-glucose 6-dehydrogenase [Candidatus Roizmanbacteria bacterium RIFOXYD1_FULL_41_2
MTITFIGHGYVGLVTACVFADFGNKVWVVGRSPDKIKKLQSGDPLIYEPGLKEMLQKNLTADRLHFTLSYEKAIAESDIVFIAVGTPPKENGEADLSMVLSVAEKIGRHLANRLTVVSCKSTVPVGTNAKIKAVIDKIKPQKAQVEVASCPEFLREGTALNDTINPDRVVIGSNSKQAISKLLELHQPLPGERVITDLSSAELIKYTANAMLANKISFANLIAFYCEKVGADVEAVLDAVGLDKRIGRIFMNPGVGYGGSCFPKDVKALIKIGEQLGVDPLFLETVEKINLQAKQSFVNKIVKHSPGKHLAVWGLSFKANTDDIREAPSLFIINELLNQGFTITAFDPVAQKNTRAILGDKINYAESPYQALSKADALVIITEWNEFKHADLIKVKKLLKQPVIFDGRNIYNPQILKKLGFRYYSVGRNSTV